MMKKHQEHLCFKQNRKAYKERLRTMPPDIAEFEIAHQESLKVEVRKPKGLKINEYIEKYKEIIYNYDFGD